MIVDVNEKGHLFVQTDQMGEVFLMAYTDAGQNLMPFHQRNFFDTITFVGLQKIFEQTDDLAYLWLNPGSDSVRLNRNVFTSKKLAAGHAVIGRIELKPGDLVDMFGNEDEVYVFPVIDGKPFNYEQRASPYVENPTLYHQYKVIQHFSELDNLIQNAEPALTQKIRQFMRQAGLGADGLVAVQSRIGPRFGSAGGALQIKLPLPVGLLKQLGVLQEVEAKWPV